MNRIIINKARVEGNTIFYNVSEEGNLGLLQQPSVNLFVRFHGDENFDCDLEKVPQSVLLVPISLYLLPLTWFYHVELVIPEMDEDLYKRLPSIYEAYSKIFGPFKNEWRGKATIGTVVKNSPLENSKYDKVVFFSGGVDACHAGINNSGRKSLLVSIPDIEWIAKNEGPLREEKFSLIKSFSKMVESDWLLISNNFNLTLINSSKIQTYLAAELGLCSPAFKFDGYWGMKYVPNMCCVAPIAYLCGVKELIMGSTFEQLEKNLKFNLDCSNPELSDSIGFADIRFAEQDGLMVRRSTKVFRIIDWCNTHGVKAKLWVCFGDDSVQCGFCCKCIRTQLNLLCAGENPYDWGFENFNEGQFEQCVKSYQYKERNPCWLWDIIDSIDDKKLYPYCNDLLHWLKKIGYKKYTYKADHLEKPLFIRRLLKIRKYPYYIKVLFSKVFYLSGK